MSNQKKIHLKYLSIFLIIFANSLVFADNYYKYSCLKELKQVIQLKNGYYAKDPVFYQGVPVACDVGSSPCIVTVASAIGPRIPPISSIRAASIKIGNVIECEYRNPTNQRDMQRNLLLNVSSCDNSAQNKMCITKNNNHPVPCRCDTSTEWCLFCKVPK